MRVPRMFYDHRVLKIILLIITFIVLSLAILNGITNLYLGIFGFAIVAGSIFRVKFNSTFIFLSQKSLSIYPRPY